jgi:hypothetical protein
MPNAQILRAEGDPTSWILDTVIEAEQLSQSSGPIAVRVCHPLQGDLLLAAGRAGSIALITPPVGGGWIPSDVKIEAPVLYVASVTGPTSDFPGYRLPGNCDTAELKDRIMTAMSAGGFLIVDVDHPSAGSSLVLNGAQLRLAVIGLPSAQGA